MQEAKKRLWEMEVQAQMAKQRLEVEEVKCRTLALQKQVQRDNKKADQEKARYEKEVAKLSKISLSHHTPVKNRQ